VPLDLQNQIPPLPNQQNQQAQVPPQPELDDKAQSQESQSLNLPKSLDDFVTKQSPKEEDVEKLEELS
jgi:hypothetical protein